MTKRSVTLGATGEQGEAFMALQVTCPPCGATIGGEDHANLLANFRQHMIDEDHDLPPTMSQQQFDAHILSEAEEVPT